MPKVIYTSLIVGTLDNMEWEPLEATEEHEFRFLSPELTEEQVAHYLSIPAFHAQTVEPKSPEAPKPTASPEIKPEVKPEGDAAGSDGKIQKGAGAKKPAAKPQSPKRETPAERKARLAAESQKGAE